MGLSGAFISETFQRQKCVDIWRRLSGGRRDVDDVDVDVNVVVIVVVISDLSRMLWNKLFGIIERKRASERDYQFYTLH